MTKKILRTAVLLFAALVLVYFAFQVYMMLYPSYKTAAATITGVSSSCAVTGIAVRDETRIETTADGVRNYLVGDGEKVGKGARVAEVYATADAAALNLRLSLLEREYTLLKKTADSGRTAGTNIDSLTNGLYDTLSTLSGDLSRGRFAQLTDARLQTLELLNSFYITTGASPSLDARIAELDARIAAIKAADIAPQSYLTTPIEGYFVSSVDGYETLVSKESVVTMTPAQLAQLIGDDAPEAGADSRIISGYKWYFAFVAEGAAAKNFAVGDSVALSIDYSSVAVPDASVESVVYDEESGTAAVVLRCDELDSEMALLRIEPATVVFRDYTGIKLERSLLHIEDGVVGVYVKYGSTVAFRRVDTVFETEDYILSRAYTGSTEYVSLYDEVITGGRELYVGKELGAG